MSNKPQVDLKYVKDVLITSCIQALQSDTYGPWIHLLEVIEITKPCANLLIASSEVLHYIHRIYQYCNNNIEINKLNIVQRLEETFVHVDLSQSSQAIIALNSREPTKLVSSTESITNSSGIYVNKHLFLGDNVKTLFSITENDMQERIYEPPSLKLTELQDYLPHVVSDIARLECTWSNSLGLTLTTLNTSLPGIIHVDSEWSLEANSDESVIHKCSSHIKAVDNQPKTGLEVVEHLVTSASKNQVEIWYLQSSYSKFHNPYNLIVISKSAIKKDHVVISIFGVLYVKADGNSELYSLGQWYTEALCFDALRKKSFFRNYLECKSLWKWKQFVCWRKFCKLKAKVSLHSLYNVPAVPDSISKLRSVLLQMQQVQFFPVLSSGYVQMKTFKSLMKEQTQSCKKYIKKLFLYCSNIINACYSDCIQYERYCYVQLDSSDTNTKESMTVTRRRREIQQKNQKTALTNVEHFDAFVKLANLLIFSEIVSIVTKQFENFVVTEILKNSKSAFLIPVLSTKQGICLDPSVKIIFETISDILSDSLSELHLLINYLLTTSIFSGESFVSAKQSHESKVHNVSHLQQVIESFDHGITESQDVVNGISNEQRLTVSTYKDMKQLITSNGSVLNALKLLKEGLENAFEEEVAYVKTLEWLDDVSSIVEEEEEIFSWKLKSPVEIEKCIISVKSKCEQMENMASYHVSTNCLLSINCTFIQKELLPKLNMFLSEQVNALLKHNKDNACATANKLQGYIEKLSKPSLEIEDFAKYQVFLNKLLSDVPTLQDIVEQIKSVYDVVKHAYHPLPQDQEEVDEELCSSWEKYVCSLQNGKDFISVHSPALIQTLKVDIQKMTKAVFEISEEVASGKYLNVGQDAKEILVDVMKLHEEFKLLYNKIRLYAECLKLITNVEMNFDELDCSLKMINTRYEIWKYYELISHTVNHWKQYPLMKLRMNIKKVYDKLMEWKRASEALADVIGNDDKVLMTWTLRIDEFERNLSILQELVHPALKERHWHKIFITLGNSYNQSQLYSVAHIISMPILDNYDKIHQICVAAISESALEDCLGNIRREWQKKDFRFAKNLNISAARKQIRKSKLENVPYTLTAISELSQEAEDSLVTLQSMMVSPHVAGVKEQVSDWSMKLKELKEIIDLFITVRQQWQYLGNRFISQNMQKIHRAEYQTFSEINKSFKELMESLMSDSKVLSVLQRENEEENSTKLYGNNLRKFLHQLILKQLHIIKQLEAYLVKIREVFPRLYFLSNNEMLDLLAITRNPPSLIPFVRKCFHGVHNIKFEMPETDATKFYSALDITLNAHLLEAVSITGNLDEELSLPVKLPFDVSVEKWLNAFDMNLKKSVWMDMYHCVQELEKQYVESHVMIDIDWLKENNVHQKYSFQSLLLYHDWIWNKFFVDILQNKTTVNDGKKIFSNVMDNLTSFLKNSKIWSFANLSDKRFLLLTQVLLLQIMYYQDQLTDVVKEDFSFVHLKMMKLNLKLGFQKIDLCNKDAFNIELDCFDASYQFGYEYYGPMSGMLITPLTDRCMLSLLLAFKDFQVGCISGDRQNGKTETVSFLAQKLARHFVSMNCTSHLRLASIRNTLVGVLLVGSIICFDNMQLLSTNYLSIIGQYFHDIKMALQSLTKTDDKHQDFQRCHSAAEAFNCNMKIVPYLTEPLGNMLFNGCVINVNPLYGAVVIMKSRLFEWKDVPSNFKKILRPISFQYTHSLQLYEAWLLISGYSSYQNLSKKLKVFLDGCDDQIDASLLSLKKIKSLIMLSGKTFRSKQLKNIDIAKTEEANLSQTLVNFLKPAVPHKTFTMLMQRIELIFPCFKCRIANNALQDALLVNSLEEQMHADNLAIKDEFIVKVLELHRLLLHNQSVILLGNPATGKTTCYTTLSRALCQFSSPWSQRKDLSSKDFPRMSLKVVYPNVFDYDQLFGSFHNESWVDGIFTKILSHHSTMNLSTSQDNLGSQLWLVIDGSLQQSWVVPFETLLNHSRKFMLANSKNIEFSDNIKLLFETDSLGCVSPSVVSSSAILYFADDNVVDWHSTFNTWKMTAHNKYSVNADELAIVEQILLYVLNEIAKFIHAECDNHFTADVFCERRANSTKHSSCIECEYILKIFSSVLQIWRSRDGRLQSSLETQSEDRVKFICHAMAYSVAHALSPLVHERSLSKLDSFIRQIFSTCPVLEVIFPTNILDSYFDGAVGEVVPWNKQKFEKSLSPISNYVVTKKLQVAFHLTEYLLANNNNVMLIGAPGTGKSSFVKNLLWSKYNLTKIQVSPSLSVQHFKGQILAKTRQPAAQETDVSQLRDSCRENFMFFIDDIHQAAGTGRTDSKPVHECMRQIICESGIYEYEGKYFRHLPQTNFIASYVPPGSDLIGADYNDPLTQRFYRHFCLVRLAKQDQDEMATVFTSLCQNWLSSYEWFPCKQFFAENIVASIIRLHYLIITQFAGKCPQYLFSYHDLSQIFKTLFLFPFNVSNVTVSGFRVIFENVKSNVVEHSVSELIQLTNKADQAKENVIQTLQTLTNFFILEIHKVYGDRMNHKDRARLKLLVQNEFVSTFKHLSISDKESNVMSNIDVLVEFMSDILSSQGTDISCVFVKNPLHCERPMRNFEMVDVKHFKSMLQEANNLDLVLFDEMVYHCANMTRVLNVQSGHALLISKNGHGRNQVTKLVSQLTHAKIFELTNSMNLNDQRAILKDTCNVAGLKGHPVFLYVPEFVSEEILTLVSALVNDGRCPALYTSSELMFLSCQLLPGSHLQHRKTENYTWMEDRFFQRIKQNLHVVLCVRMEDLQNLINKFPMFLHKMALIDIYESWNDRILQQIAVESLANMHLDIIHNGYKKILGITEISTILPKIHQSVCSYIESLNIYKEMKTHLPLKYLEFVYIFKEIFSLVVHEKMNIVKQFEAAAEKTNMVKETINNLSYELSALAPVIDQSKNVLSLSEKEMKSTQAEYSELKKAYKNQEKKITELRIPCQILTKETENEFLKCKPLYDAAVLSVKSLDEHAVEEIRSYNAPPVGVKYVAEMLCIMFNVPPQWSEAKLLLMKEKFIQNLQFYDKENISESVFAKLSSFVDNPSSKPEELAKISQAAKQLSVWIHAVHSYSKILADLQPKKDVLVEAEHNVDLAEKEFERLKMQLSNVKEEYHEKVGTYNNNVNLLKELYMKRKSLSTEKTHAESLLKTMEVFTNEWSQKISSAKYDISKGLCKNILLAGLVVYSGILTYSEQEQLLENWNQILVENDLGLIDHSVNGLFSDGVSCPSEQDEWKKTRFSKHVSFINNVLRIRCINGLGKHCWPLLIDPCDISEELVCMVEDSLSEDLPMDNHAVISEISQNFRIVLNGRVVMVNADHEKLDEILKLSIQSSCAVLVKHIERLKGADTTLKSIVDRTYNSNRNTHPSKLRMGSHTVVCNTGFRLYLSTSSIDFLKNKNTSVSFNHIIPINLGSCFVSLQHDLHHLIVLKENPSLYAQLQRTQLDMTFLQNEKKLVHSTILDDVATKTMKLLERKNILDYMGYWEENLLLLDEKFIVCTNTYKGVMKKWTEYEALAKDFCHIYFLIQKLCSLHPLYSFSMQSFMEVIDATFQDTACTKSLSTNVHARGEEIKAVFIKNVFHRMAISVFEEHVLLFPICITLDEMRKQMQFTDAEWMLFVSNYGQCTENTIPDVSKPIWINEEVWLRLSVLSQAVSGFADLLQCILRNETQWKEYFQLRSMFIPPPYQYSEHLNKFHQALLWLAYDSTLFPDICRSLILCGLGPDFIKVPSFHFDDGYKLTKCSLITLVIRPTDDKFDVQDPVETITTFSKHHGSALVLVSMGDENQMKYASQILRHAVEEGKWVVLQNCHLVKKWNAKFMTELIKLFEEMKKEGEQRNRSRSQQFRLWLIMESSPQTCLPQYICKHSITIIWQYSKNTMEEIKGIIRSSIKDSETNEDVTELCSTIFYEEFMKVKCGVYSPDSNVCFPDQTYLQFISQCLTNRRIHSPKRKVKDIVYLPRLSNQHDTVLLHEDDVTTTVNTFNRSEVASVILERIYTSPKPTTLCRLNEIEEIAQEFLGLVKSVEMSCPNLLTKHILAATIQSEIQQLRTHIHLCYYDLTLLVKALKGNAPNTKRIEGLWQTLSHGLTPNVWNLYKGKSRHLRAFIQELKDKISFFYSVLTSYAKQINLSYFNRPKFFVNAIKLQYAFDNKAEGIEPDWLGQIVSGSEVRPSANRFLLVQLKMHNGHYNTSDSTISVGDVDSVVIVPYVQFLPSTSCLPAQQRINVFKSTEERDRVLFEISCSVTSENIGNVYFTIF